MPHMLLQVQKPGEDEWRTLHRKFLTYGYKLAEKTAAYKELELLERRWQATYYNQQATTRIIIDDA